LRLLGLLRGRSVAGAFQSDSQDNFKAFSKQFTGLERIAGRRWRFKTNFECNKIPCFVVTDSVETYANALKIGSVIAGQCFLQAKWTRL
jgi:hypothetical protein